VPETLQAFYLPLFIVTAGLILVLEWLSPLQRRKALVRQRWTANLGLYCFAYLISLLILPAGILAYSNSVLGRGLTEPAIPLWLSIPATILLLDFWRYWQHWLFHKVSLLWHIHLVHHSDTNLDVTTTERHHPFEMVLSVLFLLAFILLLAPPVEGLLAYTLMATAVSLWSHANINLPVALDRALRSAVVTPAVHAVHHSDRARETNSNYGTTFTLWDRAFNTYTKPDESRQIRFGLEYFHQERDRSLWRALLQPLLYHPGMEYPARTNQASLKIAPERDLLVRWKFALAMLLGCSLLLIVAFSSTVQTLTETWWAVSEWQYAILVLPMFLYLMLAEYRQELFSYSPKASWAGLIPALLGAGIMLAGEILDINFARQLALVIFLQALILAILGTKLYTRHLALWLLPFLIVPYSDLVMPVLRHGTLLSVEIFSGLFKLPFESSGFSFSVAENGYVIVPACAGMTYFTLAIFLSYSLGLVLYRRLLPVLRITAIAATLAVLANSVRVNAIIFMDLQNGTQASLEEHSPYYWLALLLMFGLLFFLFTRLNPDKTETSAVTAPDSEAAGQWWRPGVATLLCLLPLFANDVRKIPLEGLPSFAPPASLEDYTLLSQPTEWQQRGDTDTTFSTATYSNGTSELAVFAEFPVHNSMKLDSWSVIPDQVGSWKRSRRDYRQSCDSCPSYIHHTWTLQETDELYNVYASYLDHSELTTSQLRLRWQRGLYKVQGGREQLFGIVAFVSDDPIPDTKKVTAILRQLQTSLSGPG